MKNIEPRPSRRIPPSRLKRLIRVLGSQVDRAFPENAQLAFNVFQGSWKEFQEFCFTHYLLSKADRFRLLSELEEFLYQVHGHFVMMSKEILRPIDLMGPPPSSAQQLFGEFSASSHLDADLQRSGIAALIQLHFGHLFRIGKTKQSNRWNQDQWRAYRLSAFGRFHVPAEIVSRWNEEQVKASLFVHSFAIPVDRVQFEDSSISFPKDTLLLSHWALRDMIVNLYREKNPLPRQRALRGLLQKVVSGEIPKEILSDSKTPVALRWNLGKGTIHSGTKISRITPTKDLRWRAFHKLFQIRRQMDRYCPSRNYLHQTFHEAREIPHEYIQKMLIEIVSAPVVKTVTSFMESQLKRPLEAHDLYYKNFDEEKNVHVHQIPFRDTRALQQAIPLMLQKIGFSRERAIFIADHIRVDNSRSAGHAFGPSHRDDKCLCRVRIRGSRVAFDEFKTFMHELGHCVEQVLSSFGVDSWLLWGVPNPACTEAFAMAFEEWGPLVLRKEKKSFHGYPVTKRFWSAYHMAGPALVELALFQWLYQNPLASSPEIHQQVQTLSVDLWKRYYHPYLGEDCGLLGSYSHMLTCGLYLTEYPLGYIISHQVMRHLDSRSKSTRAQEIERICRIGKLTPTRWMIEAVGKDISPSELILDTQRELMGGEYRGGKQGVQEKRI